MHSSNNYENNFPLHNYISFILEQIVVVWSLRPHNEARPHFCLTAISFLCSGNYASQITNFYCLNVLFIPSTAKRKRIIYICRLKYICKLKYINAITSLEVIFYFFLFFCVITSPSRPFLETK